MLGTFQQFVFTLMKSFAFIRHLRFLTLFVPFYTPGPVKPHFFKKHLDGDGAAVSLNPSVHRIHNGSFPWKWQLRHVTWDDSLSNLNKMGIKHIHVALWDTVKGRPSSVRLYFLSRCVTESGRRFGLTQQRILLMVFFAINLKKRQQNCIRLELCDFYSVKLGTK